MHVIVENRPLRTGDPVPTARSARIVVTVLEPRPIAGALRHRRPFQLMPGASPCGRTNRRIRGWLGRADQTQKVKGMFVHADRSREVLKRHRAAARPVGRSTGPMVRHHDPESEAADDNGLAEAWRQADRVTKLKGGLKSSLPERCPTTAR
jgi:phenylacetate-CoA ligase